MTLADDFEMSFVKQNVQSQVTSHTSCAGRQEDDSSKVLMCCYCAEHLLVYRRECTAMTTEMKFWPEECVAALQIRCRLFVAVVLLSGDRRRKLLVSKCWLGGRCR